MSLLQTVFVVLLILKLAGLITLGWLWVFSPLMVSALIWFLVFLLAYILND